MAHVHAGKNSLTTHRVEALHDGVFAIVMTLLVLEFKLPELTEGYHLSDMLIEQWPTFLSYVITFVNLGIYWVGQHTQFHYIRATDRILLWINIAFLMFIALLPLSTSLLSRFNDQPLPYVIYGVNLIVIGLIAYLHWCYATTHHRLTDHDVGPALVRGVKRRILVAPLVSVIAIACAFISMTFSLLMYVLLAIYYIWPGKIDEFWSLPAIPHED